MLSDDEMAKMGRPPKEQRSQVRTKLVVFRLTADEVHDFTEAAEKDKKESLSEWLRDLGLARVKRLKR